jgi:ribosomal-protein-alanine acetyltransferase
MAARLSYRPAAPADLDAMERIETAVFATDRASRRQLGHAIRSPSILCLAAERDGRLEGYAVAELRRGSRIAHLVSIAVAPEAGGRGIGAALLAALEAAARARGCDRVRLEVRDDNGPAQRLYDRAGYTRFAVLEDYYEDGAGAWRYEKRMA